MTLLLATPACAWSEILAPLDWIDRGLAVATVKIDGCTQRLVVDTGASASVLFSRVPAPTKRAPGEAQFWLSGVDTRVRQTRLIEIEFGSGAKVGARVPCAYAGAYPAWEAAGCDGLLGLDLLQGLPAFALRHSQGLICAEASRARENGIEAAMLNDGRAVLAADDPFGAPRTFLLDTAAVGAVYLQKDTAATLGRVAALGLKTSRQRLRAPNGALRDYLLCYPERWDFAGMVIEEPAVFVLIDDGTDERPQPDIVGMAVLRQFDHFWDFGARRVALEPLPRDPFEAHLRANADAFGCFKAAARGFQQGFARSALEAMALPAVRDRAITLRRLTEEAGFESCRSLLEKRLTSGGSVAESPVP